MRFSTVITSALAAAVVSAAPVEKRAVATTWVVDIVTSYTTIYPGKATPVASPVASPIAAVQQSSSAAAPVATQAPVAAPEPQPQPAPVPAPAPASSQAAAPSPVSVSSGSTKAGTCSPYSPPSTGSSFDSCGVDVLTVANKWRAKYNKTPFTWASNIAQAAQHTSQHNQGGVTMEHPGLVDGAMGECITPGFWEIGDIKTEGMSPFEVALMGWLCEVSSDSQLQPENNGGLDVCKVSRDAAMISGSKDGGSGHHDIFLSDSYSTIGVYYQNDANGNSEAAWAGQWTADFA